MSRDSDTRDYRVQAELNEVQEELVANQQQLDQLMQRVNTLEDELAFTRHTLAHRLGSAIVNNLSFRKIWRMPNSIYSAVKGYRRAKDVLAERAKQDTEVEPPAKCIEPIESANPHWPEPVVRHLLWQAQHIASSHSIDSACEFVETHGDDTHNAGLHLLKSNRHESDDEQWLTGVNQYLNQFGIASIRLLDIEGPRFSRLGTDELPKVTAGPLVSIIMPTYNAQDTAEKAIRSILNQTWQNLELIVNDDCSSDATFAIAQRIAEQDNRVRVFRNPENVGPYVSKNRALQWVSGDFITGHDADDWAHPHRIERQVQGMLDNPKWQISIGYMLRMRDSGHFSHFSKMGKTSPDGALRLASISCFFRSDFLKTVLGHWDCVRFGADSEMIERCRCILKEEEFGTQRIMTMLCLDGEDSLTNNPHHGVSKLTGVSPTREFYRKQWSAWHEGLEAHDAFLAFPESPRKFAAPDEALVPEIDIARVVVNEVNHST